MSTIENNAARLQAIPQNNLASNAANTERQLRSAGNREITYQTKMPLDRLTKSNNAGEKNYQNLLSKTDVANNSQKFKLAQALNQLSGKAEKNPVNQLKTPSNDRIKPARAHQQSNIKGQRVAKEGKGLGPGPKGLTGAQKRALRQLAKNTANLPNQIKDAPKLDQANIEHIWRQAKQNDWGALQRAAEVRRAMQQFQ